MLLDIETLRKSADELHPDIAEWIKANGEPPCNWESLEQVRIDIGRFSDASRAAPPDPAITEHRIKITLRDGHQSDLKIHRRTGAPTEGSPLLIHLFGGGFMSGDEDQGSALGRAWVRLFGATVVTPAYRLAPEHKFPTSQLDCWDAIKWLDEHAAEISADPKAGFIIAGSSAGAGIASAIATHAIENPLKNPITGQHLQVPTLLTKESLPEKYKPYFLAHEQCQNTTCLKTSDLELISRTAEDDPKSPWRYPIYSKAPLSKQPRAFFMIDGGDPLRDDGLIWDEMLKEAGVETRVEFYPGCPHSHGAFVPGVPISIKSYGDYTVGMGWLLGKEIPWELSLKAALGPLES